ncbi:MAG: creatininase family protein [Pseudomonadota bacterium]
MQLALMTWREVEAYLKRSDGIIIPIGSTEQHGPMGLIGTDALCADAIAVGAAEKADALCAPPITYTPAPFNLAFPGSVSISPHLLVALVEEIIAGLTSQGFRRFYVLNGHGANLEPLGRVKLPNGAAMRVKSWWDFQPVNDLRATYYGAWEGMHATPSEVAITQAIHRVIAVPDEAKDPPERLSPDFIAAHAGDKHGPPDEHRARFPDGRVGSHSALAKPEHGDALLAAAIQSVAEDYLSFLQ